MLQCVKIKDLRPFFEFQMSVYPIIKHLTLCVKRYVMVGKANTDFPFVLGANQKDI
uniref:Uncharacterized protein n=1 Tax=Utricularia reniformis TaxID=192314 RepID=A0A1Y0B4W6_9LAMI|nr:hypothetical protein AEK19_MT2292 [Utricularia reniformis]ART32437.1 hypothetical protein AEK19_MT2292 [Utricularia reniformis]